MSKVDNTSLLGRFLKLPLLTLVGILLLVIFLIVGVAVGIVAAAYEFGNAFRTFFNDYFYVIIVAIALIVAGIIIRRKYGVKGSANTEPETQSSGTEAPGHAEDTSASIVDNSSESTIDKKEE